MRAEVDPGRCTRCGICSDSVPAVFVLLEESAAVKVDTVPPELEEEVLEVRDTCPAEAISVS